MSLSASRSISPPSTVISPPLTVISPGPSDANPQINALLNIFTSRFADESENTFPLSDFKLHRIAKNEAGYQIDVFQISSQQERQIPISPPEFKTVRDTTNKIITRANQQYQAVIKSHQIGNFLKSIMNVLRMGNVNWGIDRNRLNNCIALGGLLILILSLIPAGLSTGALAGIGIVIIISTTIALAILVYQKKLSISQATAYSLLVILITSLVLSPVGATALLVFKLFYGVTLLVQGAVFGVIRGGIGLVADKKTKYEVAREINDSSRLLNAKIAMVSDSFSIAKGVGYSALGILRIISSAMSIAIPGCQVLTNTIIWTTAAVYLGLVNGSLIPKIYINFTDMRRCKEYHSKLEKIYGRGTTEECRQTLLWLRQNLISNGILLQGEQSDPLLMQKIQESKEMTDSSISQWINVEIIDRLLVDLDANDIEQAQRFIKLILASNLRKHENAKTQLKINLLYLLGNTFLVSFSDPLMTSSEFTNFITDKLLHLNPEAIAGFDPIFQTSMTNAQAIQRAWSCAFSAIKGTLAAQINVGYREYAELPPRIPESEAASIEEFDRWLKDQGLATDSAVPPQNADFHDYWHDTFVSIAKLIRKAWNTRRRKAPQPKPIAAEPAVQ